MDDRYLRQQDAVDMKRLSALPVTLIGAGSIGSITALYLGKMGIEDIRIFDPDIVEEHNWSNQMFRSTDIGKPKGQALFEVMQEFGMQTPIVLLEKYVDRPLSEVVICAVDSMSSRKTIWKQARKQQGVRLFIDARMGLETLIVHAVRPQVREDRIRYSQSLHSDADSLQENCTSRTICYTPLMASAVICNLVKRYVNHEQLPCQILMDLVTYNLMLPQS
ncbi:MAG: ThiF family adenylyltransferase [Calditrichaeota bacterium]|nr:ThiF family adenylyltransferase [Calditrichota bacterium]